VSESPPERPAEGAGPSGWTWGPHASGAPGYGPPPAPAPQPQYGAPQYGTPQYGAPQYGTPQYGTPQYGTPQYGTPQYGTPQYGQPQYGQPQYGAPYGVPYGAPPVPVQRGIIPLRPLTLGEIYDGAFKSIRANPRVMFGFSMLVMGVAALIGGLAWYVLTPTVSRWVDSTLGSDVTVDQTGTEMLASVWSMYAMLPFLGLAGIVLSGILTVSVSRSVLGQKIAVGDLWRGYWKRTLMVVGYTLLGTVVAVAFWALIVLAIGAIGSASAGAGVVFGIVSVVGGLVVSVWVGYRLLLVPPVLMLEGGRFVPSIVRAWRLTRGSFWRLLGINLLAQIIANVVSQVLGVPVSIIGAILMVEGTLSVGFIATMTIGMAITYTIPAIFLAAVVALQYIDLRIRREGLDVQLARAAEAAAGTA